MRKSPNRLISFKRMISPGRIISSGWIILSISTNTVNMHAFLDQRMCFYQSYNKKPYVFLILHMKQNKSF